MRLASCVAILGEPAPMRDQVCAPREKKEVRLHIRQRGEQAAAGHRASPRAPRLPISRS